ncbi:MAG TPA: GNAT family N-acetyltransferase [Blastocatellia bacterium]|jgi:predicted GNAT superfamily acetyltransferase|nr:GNAT family N-acetyltransferase [Blastocatellia bacterium]
MFEWTIDDRRFHIREARTEDDYHAIEDIQKEAWGFSDLDVVPMATLVATVHAGGIALGAFEGERMIGFAYGFPALEEGRLSIHSHMLAVRNDCRNLQAGFYLKVAQRDLTLGKGVETISWTFDPLQSLNAHLNFNKLGVISRRYIVNFYGEASSSPLHRGFGTDRLWVSWLLESDRVKSRITARELTPMPGNREIDPESRAAPLLVRRVGDEPRLSDFSAHLSGNSCLIEIPHDINILKDRNPAVGRAWREATRAAFLAALEEGFLVEDLLRRDRASTPGWFYLLTR